MDRFDNTAVRRAFVSGHAVPQLRPVLPANRTWTKFRRTGISYEDYMRQRFATSVIKKKCSAVSQILKRFFDPKKDREFREKLKDTYDGAVAGDQ